MELNLLNEKLNIDVNKYHNVNEKRFWYYYCNLLNIRNQVLNEKDCVILSILLNEKVDTNLGNIDLMKRISLESKTALPNLYKKYKELVSKGFLLKTEDGFLLSPFFKSFQIYIKDHLENDKDCPIKFSIPFNVTHEYS